MFTSIKNNAKMTWDYGRDPVCIRIDQMREDF